MTDPLDSVEEPDAAELSALDQLLARGDVWDEPPAGLEDAVVASIAAEPHPPVALDDRRAGRDARTTMPWWLGAAAVVALVVAGVALIGRDSTQPSRGDVEIAMRGTDAAPAASATVRLASTPAGLKILLDAEGLPGAPEGYYYEAWVSDGTTLVSAGTFHLRRGDNEIELWAGVVDPRFDTISVTLEPIDGAADSSGDVRLRGEYDLTRD